MTTFETALRDMKDKSCAEIVYNTLSKQCYSIAFPAGLHCASIFWYSCFGLENRVGYFEEITDTQEYAHKLADDCVKGGNTITFSVYVDGKLYLTNNIYSSMGVK